MDASWSAGSGGAAVHRPVRMLSDQVQPCRASTKSASSSALSGFGDMVTGCAGPGEGRKDGGAAGDQVVPPPCVTKRVVSDREDPGAGVDGTLQSSRRRPARAVPKAGPVTAQPVPARSAGASSGGAGRACLLHVAPPSCVTSSRQGRHEEPLTHPSVRSRSRPRAAGSRCEPRTARRRRRWTWR